jgi:hypothetical protein
VLVQRTSPSCSVLKVLSLELGVVCLYLSVQQQQCGSAAQVAAVEVVASAQVCYDTTRKHWYMHILSKQLATESTRSLQQYY